MAGMPSGVVVTVKDNGKGISAELKEKVFSPFCTTKAARNGIGLADRETDRLRSQRPGGH